MLNRLSIATFCALLVGLFAAGTASAVPNRPPSPPPTTYWQNMGFILMAHQGGEWDFPPNTMYAYKQAMALGADMIDMDAFVTKDGKLVLTHDLQAFKNSEAPDDGNHDINQLTLAELKQLDFAYDWTPHDSPGGTAPPFRGVATGAVTPPAGFTAADFRIPTFDEVLAAFPNTPINIELKEVAGVNIDETTAEMASVLAAHPGHDENVIINSFGQAMLDSMHLARPQHKSFSGSLSGSLDYVQGTAITPTPVAIEPPDLFQLFKPPAAPSRTVPVLKPFADYDGYKIFVWGSDKDPAQDTPAFYQQLISEGADSYNTPDPIALAAYLCTAGIARPDGTPRCAQQQCPVGQEGIAPNNCKAIPCPAGTTGTSPNCVPVPVVVPDPPKLKLVSFSVPKLLKSGKRAKFSVKLKNTGDTPAAGIKICVRGNIASGVIRGKIVTGSCQKIQSLGAGKIAYKESTIMYKATTGKTGKTKSLRAAISTAKQGKSGKAKMALRVTSDNAGTVTATKTVQYTAKQGKTGSAK